MPMLTNLQSGIKEHLRRLGYAVARRPPDQPGLNPFVDVRRFIAADCSPVVFDVGANVGQSVERIKTHFPRSIVHSFEPSPETFAQLKQTCARFSGVHQWNCGVGSAPAQLPLLENAQSDMSSFLEMTELGWGRTVKTTTVEVVPLDEFCRDKSVERIDLLKSDTQGYDFEVLKGAARLMAENRINLICLEVMFSAMYREAPGFDQVYRFLLDRNFSLVTFYGFHFQQGRVSWTDALFINNDYHRTWLARQGGVSA